MSRTRDPMPPPDLEGYTYVDLLGSGGFSDVFLYERDFPRQKVAIKVLVAEAIGDTGADRFTRRGQRDGVAVDPPLHRHHLRGPHRAVGPPVPGDGVLPAAQHARAGPQRAAPRRRRAPRGHPGRVGARVGPPHRRAAPRHQAGQHPHQRLRATGADRLRDRGRRGRADRRGRGHVHPVGVARDRDLVAATRRAVRRVLPRRDDVDPAVGRAVAVRGLGELEPEHRPDRPHRADHGPRGRSARRARVAAAPARPGPVEGTRRPALLGRRLRPRPAGDRGRAAVRHDAVRGRRRRRRRPRRQRARRQLADARQGSDRRRDPVRTGQPAPDLRPALPPPGSDDHERTGRTLDRLPEADAGPVDQRHALRRPGQPAPPVGAEAPTGIRDAGRRRARS